MKKYLLAALAASIVSSQAGVITFSSAFTDDISTGIDSANTYTHAISGGETTTVNGVAFSALTESSTPANFSWTVTSPPTATKSTVINNTGSWNVASSGVTGAGAIDLLSSFTYHLEGAEDGEFQTFSLSNLTIGEIYDTRLYIRPWSLSGANRAIELSYTHGLENNSLTFDEDRPVNVIGGSNVNAAYYISYQFTAQATTLSINATVPNGSPAASGSFHMYGLTNQVIPEPSGAALLMSFGLLGLVRRRR